jgi:hypothetical protein
LTDAVTDHPTPRHRSRRLRWWILATLGVLVLLIAVALYLGYLGLKAKSSIESARGHAATAQQAFLDGDVQTAIAEANAAVTDAKSAKDDAHNPVWTGVALVPWLGDPLHSVQKMTESVDGLATDVLAPTAGLSDVINPNSLRTADNTINVAALAQAQPELNQIAARAEELQSQVANTDGSWLSNVSDARIQLLNQLTESARFIRGTDFAAQLLPPMLGAGGERNYFFGFQTPAESRATGGLLGAYGVVGARDGRINVGRLGANATLLEPENPIDLGPEFNKNYGYNRPYTDVRNSNLSAHFPYAAQIWMSMWEQQTDTKLDGAVALDPIALSYLLKATGPITLDSGEQISADNVVEVTLSTSYSDYSRDNAARKAYLQEIAQKSIAKVTATKGRTGAILEALGHSVQERRLMVYSSHEDEQRLLEQAGMAHEIAETKVPYAAVTVGNLAGNKIDYYLKRSITYRAAKCEGSERKSTVEVKLTNTVEDLSLPRYVIGNLGNPQLELSHGTNFSSVTLYATDGATLESATVEGQPMLYSEGSERGHPFFTTQVKIPAGKTATLRYSMIEPVVPGEAQVPVQPLVDDPEVNVAVPTCGK